MRRILVYGTLRQGQRANRALQDAQFVDTVNVTGFDMYNLGGFPGVVENENNKVGIVGEVYALPDGEEGNEILRHLDYYEGYYPQNLERSNYLRKEIEVLGQPTFIYVFNRPINLSWYQPIPGGDWNKRNEESNANLSSTSRPVGLH
jgi:gamma-glutamylcyclotransferase (GGCT)/AIG2-like uncharacterized protein YtfP